MIFRQINQNEFPKIIKITKFDKIQKYPLTNASQSDKIIAPSRETWTVVKIHGWKNLGKNSKKWKKVLDKLKIVCYTIQAVREGSKHRVNSRKVFLRKLKKVLDKSGTMWYNNKAVRESGKRTDLENWTTKDEKTKPLNRRYLRKKELTRTIPKREYTLIDYDWWYPRKEVRRANQALRSN